MADIITDFTKPAQQIIVDLVNNDNTTALTPGLLTFGLPSVPTGSPARDTDLTLTAIAGSGYTGSVTVHYNRVNLADVPGARSTDFPLGDAVNVSDLIPEINAAYGIALSNTVDPTHPDFTDGALPTFTGEPNEDHTFPLIADADSLVWENQVTLSVHGNDIPLDTVVTSTTLNGLTYIQPA